LSEISGLNIDPATVTVSGISSGAFMAVQFHVSHSANVGGVGVIAGGPYRCSQGSNFWSWMDLTGLYIATSVCSNTNAFWFFQGPPDVDFSTTATIEAARSGHIDHPTNLKDDRVWLFSGGEDKEVPTLVMKTVAEYYETFVQKTNIALEENPDANHAMITENFGNACDAFGPPYINDCDVDAAEQIFTHIYGPLEARAAATELSAVLAFDQTKFFDDSDPSVSMNEVGHLYVPASCAEGARCRLHVAFHGCQQYQEKIGDAFFANAGYNHWAESNDIVVLYPQTKAWNEGFFPVNENPKGCWDWWGYSGEDFYHKSGKQIRAVATMVNELLDQQALKTPTR
jgi:poly(3-hydroxybutyrate) depolymerase